MIISLKIEKRYDYSPKDFDVKFTVDYMRKIIRESTKVNDELLYEIKKLKNEIPLMLNSMKKTYECKRIITITLTNADPNRNQTTTNKNRY